MNHRPEAMTALPSCLPGSRGTTATEPERLETTGASRVFDPGNRDEQQVELDTAKTEFDDLIERAPAGEEVVISRKGEPLVRLVPIPNPPKRVPRVPGRYKGKIWIAPDCFEPTSDEELELWDGVSP